MTSCYIDDTLDILNYYVVKGGEHNQTGNHDLYGAGCIILQCAGGQSPIGGSCD